MFHVDRNAFGELEVSSDGDVFECMIENITLPVFNHVLLSVCE